MYKVIVAFRYMRSNWLNFVAIAAVAIAVIVPVCVLSVLKGFSQEFRAQIRATLSDLVVDKFTDATFGDYEDLMAKIERIPHVDSCAPDYSGLALIRLAGRWRYGQFRGIDIKREIRTTEFAHYWRRWRGQEAREEIARQLLESDGKLPPVARAAIKHYVSTMRQEDFDALDPVHARRVRQWAEESGFNLEAVFKAAAIAEPAWGAVDDPKQSQAFPGAECLIVGRYPDGTLQRLRQGDELVLACPTSLADLATSSDRRVFRKCRVSGAFRSGLYEFDQRTVYLPLADVQKYIGTEGHVTSINVRLSSFDRMPEVRDRLLGILSMAEIEQGVRLLEPLLSASDPDALRHLRSNVAILREKRPKWFAEENANAGNMTRVVMKDLSDFIKVALAGLSTVKPTVAQREELRAYQKMMEKRKAESLGPHFRVTPWENKRRNLLRAVDVERRLMGFILFFVMLIAGFLILSILHTTVLAKMRDIAILKSIGGTVRGIMGIYIFNGLFVGVIGCAIGTVISWLITSNINGIESILARITGSPLFPRDIYYLESIPVDKEPFWSVVWIIIMALSVSLLASAYPAWKASRMDPVEALRYE